MLGIAVGVMALIVILSVMNGFENELRQRLLGMTAHARISASEGALEDWGAIRDEVLSLDAVAGAAPVTVIEGMIRNESTLYPVLVEGIDPDLEGSVSDIEKNIVVGSLDSLTSGSGNIILGRILMLRLRVMPGDKIVVLVPAVAGNTIRPELRSFTVSGMFEAGVQEHDSSLALIHQDDAARALGMNGGVSALRIRLNDLFAAPGFGANLAGTLGEDYAYSDWTKEHASFFRAVMLEKMMMSIILSLIIAVAAFNIVASLVMVVTDKRTDIAILRTLGLSPRSVVRVFLVQGLTIGWFGALLGIALGVVLAINVPVIVPWLEQMFGFQIMPGDVYVVSQIPSELHWSDVLKISVMALVLTGIATLYPARRAAAVEPALALRYE